jgi:two-component sensor histidine kinase
MVTAYEFRLRESWIFSNDEIEPMLRSRPIFFIIVALLIICTIGYSSVVGVRLTSKYTPLIDAIMQVKYETTAAHMWFEEMINGDRDEDMDYIDAFFEKAEFHARAIINGGSDSEWLYYPVEDDRLEQELTEIAAMILGLRGLTVQRYDMHRSSEAGADLERQYDALYLNIIMKASHAEEMLHKIVRDDLYRFKSFQFLIALSVIVGSLFIILLLSRHQQEMENKISALDNSNIEKEILLKEVHHRVKNNMTVISSLLSLQSGYVDDRKYREMFEESQGRIRSMALVHDKLYQSGDFVHIGVRDYVLTLVESVKVAFAGDLSVSSVVEVEDIDLDIDTLVPCGLIMNELLTNIMKHAFDREDNAEFRVEMINADESNVSLTVSDNGRGLPEGFDLSGPLGLGLKLVRVLVEQINGTIEAESRDGARFRLLFPRTIQFSPVE